jgi:hypothetical protein
MDSWVPLEAVALYAIVALSFALSLLAVIFAYKLSRITGLFSAWALLIGGLALTAFEDFAYFGSVIFVSYSKVLVTVEAFTFGTFLIAALVLVAIPALFFGAMYKLHSLFAAQRKKPSQPKTARELAGIVR